MNTQQVEFLAEAIASLQTEDYPLFQSALISKMVKKTPGVAGGHACVRNTRIAVWTLISLSHQGMDDESLVNDFEGLTHFDLLAAKMYYRANQSEIDTIITSHHNEDWQ